MVFKHAPLLYKFLSMLMVLIVTTQCVAAPASSGTTPSSTAPIAGETQLPQATPSSEAVNANVTEESTAVDLSAIPYLGNTSFTVDSTTSVTGKYKADGTELRLELTDGAGLTWTLIVPDQALDSPQTITMTSLKDISSEDIVGNLVSGVQLEPDGLQFIIPAMLSVTGATLPGTTLLLGGNQDGSQMSFLIPDTSIEGTSALIYHFSSAMGDGLDDSQIPGMLKQALATYAELAKQARQILKTEISTPAPPSSKLRCMDEDESKDSNEQFEKFQEVFNNPELVWVSSLIAAQRNIALLGGDSPGFSLESSLLQRQLTKVQNLITNYGKQAEYLPAITKVALQSMRNHQLLGGNDAASQKLWSQLSSMWEKAVDVLIKELAEKHEYRNVSAIIETTRTAALLGSQIDLQKVLEKMRKVMHFDLELKYTLTVATTHHWNLEANFPVKFEGEFPEARIKGDGTGNLSSYVYDGAPEYSATAPAFSVNAEFLEFYPCEGTAKFSVDQFFPASETVTIADPEDPRTFSQNITQLGWETHFGDKLVDGRYTFEVTINNNSENAVDQSFTQVYGPNETIFEIKVKHTPQQ